MDHGPSVERPAVEILAPEVSRRIAAGEVIERPASVIRELVDNSIDAGADTIDISWTGGGAELLRVHDNGCGLSRQDLELCWQPHATSKIRSIEDLDHSRSLGFRGEALSSIAAVSALSITTARPDGDSGFRMTVDRAVLKGIDPAPPVSGTTVEVRRLFANLPARRRFLSRPQAETTAIRNVVLDKALPFPSVRFSYSSDSSVKAPTVLPPKDRVGRVADVLGSVVPVQSLHEITGSGDGFDIVIVAAQPEIVRRDRRYIRVFVNNRRVWEYGLIQAVEYAYQDVQHGGLFPVAAVFVDIEPELVDFNIHPAKKEVRIRPAAEVHHRVVEILRSFLKAYTVKTVQYDREFRDPTFRSSFPASEPPGVPGKATPGSRGHQSASAAERPSFAYQIRAIPPEQSAAEAEDLVIHGTLFGTYIIAEWQDIAFLIDQHAAHERLLYNHLQEHRTSQTLLVPEVFEVTPDQRDRLLAHTEEYREIGIHLRQQDDCMWQLTAIPGEYPGDVESIIEMIIELEGLQERYDRSVLAEVACKAAVKGGDFVDNLSALELARRTLQLDPPRCPHGRPLWIELTRGHLEKLIGRR